MNRQNRSFPDESDCRAAMFHCRSCRNSMSSADCAELSPEEIYISVHSRLTRRNVQFCQVAQYLNDTVKVASNEVRITDFFREPGRR
ncbi:hypothetical protein [Catalinimonas niigatensis]|uniref:hypothetical protein n=1 Tax=Catalinimonas niigatensis TaxID=1397264 RepID=UPI002666A8CD|nr:hypothetical protein [Catalinimonas niigatensis]WPP50829.1 hypothetical protein PZB72_00275 [Catalinimonas niigatensis]